MKTFITKNDEFYESDGEEVVTRSHKLRESAKDCPHCMSCGLANPNGDRLCLAHSNELVHGRGAYHKSDDIFGAIVCQICHDEIDGRRGNLTRDEKHEKHRLARERTLAWWWRYGYVVAGKVA